MKTLIAFLICLSGCAMPSKTEAWCLPKRVTRTIASMFMLAFAATSSALEPGYEERDVQVFCREGKCLISQSDLEWMHESNDKLHKELEEARKTKKVECGKLEVEPKPLPKIPKERNS